MRKFLLWIVLLTIHFSSKAQEPTVYSQFFMNPYIYNPAYAGVDGHTVISIMYRQQWVGLNDAPNIAHVTFHSPLKGGLGVGAFVFNERFSVINSSGIKGTVSYLANFDRKHWLRFGLSLGAGSNSIDLDELDNPFDPAFTNVVKNGFHALGDFGITYHSGHFNVGVSIPNLFSHDVFATESFSDVRIKPYDNMFFKMNYSVGFFDDDFVFEPHLLYRYSNQNADQYEAAAIIHVAHHIWFGGSFRQDAGIIGLFGIKVKEKLAIGYAFELGDSKVNSFTGNTHELHIGFHLGSRKEHAEHASSFIKRHRKTAEERKEEAEQRRLARLEALKGPAQPDPNQNALLQTEEPEEEDPSPVETPVDTTPPVTGTPSPAVVPGTNNPIDQTLTEDRRTPDELAQSDQPLRVKEGNHLLELAPGDYVINGAFRVFEHAENFSDKLFERGFHDVIVGYVTATGYYYVVVNKAEDVSAASAEAKRLRGRQGFEKTWVLSVE